jgi:uncharacterized protein (TIGR00645 family)
MIEKLVETVIFASRWLLVPLFLGLTLVLVIYAAKFFQELAHLFATALAMDDAGLLIAALTLVDATLVASLLVMVIISGYENFVSRLDVDVGRHNIAWLGKLDHGSLKIKLASSIVAISSIHLLKAFMNVELIGNDKLMWLVVIHLTFVVSALLLAYIDRVAFRAEARR